MNESIIRELAFKAGAKLYMEPPSQEVTGVSMSVESVRRFAELIVRECIQIIDDSTPVYSPNDLQEDYCQGKLNGYQSALLEIKQHFGIKK